MRPTERKHSKMVKCYGCGELGHKFPACPRAKPRAVRRVGTTEPVKSKLAGNEIMIEVAGNLMPATGQPLRWYQRSSFLPRLCQAGPSNCQVSARRLE